MADQLTHIEDSLLRELSRARVNAVYHTARRGFYVVVWRFLTVASLVSFSVAIVGFVGEFKELYPKYIAAVSALTFVIDLLFAPALASAQHAVLARRYVSLERAINRALAADLELPKMKAALAEILSERLDIEVEEPPVLRWLWVWAHNQVAVSHGSTMTYKITGMQRFLKQWVDLSDVEQLEIEKSTRQSA